jgi:hypothetical protein
MSFSFRNIFSPDENGLEGVPTGFDQPGHPIGEGTGRSGLAPAGENAEVPGQSFLISELIAFIPPAISAQNGIPMSREVRIPLPADGSRDVKLSTIYQLCPELFAAEITPLNDSTVTLPPKLGAMGVAALEGATGFSQPSAEKAPTGFPVSPASAGNPFWSPTPPKAEEITATATPSDMKDEQPRTRQDEKSVWPREPVAGMNPFGVSGSAVPAKGNAFGAPGAAAAPVGDDSGFSGGFSGFESQPLSSLFGTGSAGAMTNEVDDKGGKPFAGNPFESEQGFNSLFSKQAEADKDIPFPTASVVETPAATADEPQGVWGAMFHGGGFGVADDAVAEVEAPFSPPALESIGNLLKQGAGAAASPAPTGFSGFEPVPELVGIAPAPAPSPAPAPAPAPARKEEAPRATTPLPVAGFPAFVTPPQAFAGFGEGVVETVATPSPIDVFANAAFEAPVEATAASVFEAPTGFGAATSMDAPAPAPAREMVEAAPARSANPAPAEIGSDLRDLELRAIFSTSESFTLSMVARRVVGLQGIVSCSLSTPGKLVQASKSDEGRLGNEAREMVTTLRSLAKLTGLPEARTFTLHTDRGIVSLFLEGECCVMVHHESAAFEPGVREKLILVARSLINLEE